MFVRMLHLTTTEWISTFFICIGEFNIDLGRPSVQCPRFAYVISLRVECNTNILSIQELREGAAKYGRWEIMFVNGLSASTLTPLNLLPFTFNGRRTQRFTPPS